MLFFNTRVDTSREKELFIRFQNLNFFKNNEYSNYMADGFTLFGYQVNPQLGYSFARNLTLEAGIFVAKDFGNNQYTQILPTFSLRYYRKDFKMVFGNLNGSLNHQLIEPLYNFERVMSNRLENGLQFIITKKKYDADLWVDWLNMIYRFSGSKEKLMVGVNANVLKTNNDKWEFRVPLQTTVIHRGGQIDTLVNEGVHTDIAFAAGFVLKRKLDSKNSKNVYLDVRYVGRQNTYDHNNTAIYSYGDGLLANIGLLTRSNTDIMLSYWNGTEFYAELGGDLYSSWSRSVAYPSYHEAVREIYILRITQKIKLAENINLTLRLEPNYDIHVGMFDYSYGFYITIDELFWLKKKTTVPSDR